MSSEYFMIWSWLTDYCCVLDLVTVSDDMKWKENVGNNRWRKCVDTLKLGDLVSANNIFLNSGKKEKNERARCRRTKKKMASEVLKDIVIIIFSQIQDLNTSKTVMSHINGSFVKYFISIADPLYLLGFSVSPKLNL